MDMTRKAFLGTAGLTLAALAGCSSNTSSDDAEKTDDTAASTDKTTLVVFAAASLTESLQASGDDFMNDNPDVELSFNFDSSGTLKTQIEEGADCDVFISAGQKQMNQLDITADSSVNTDGLDFIDNDTRFDILENKVVLVVPEGNPDAINSFQEMAEKLKAGEIMLAMGNEDVPVGQYTQKILAYFDLNEEELAQAGHITYGSNVKEVTTQVSEGTVGCGIVYQTDAYSADLEVVEAATEEMCGRVVYPAAALKASKNLDLAKTYLDFLKGPEASEDFEAVGFTPLAEEN
jgi:molybdate transport system substrate-binding protein